MPAYATTGITTTASPMAGGLDPLDGIGNEFTLAVNYTPVQGDMVTVTVSDTASGLQTQIGAGYASQVGPTFCFTFNNRIFALGSSPFVASSAFYSALTFPAVWNDPNAAGDGFTTMTNWFAGPASLQGVAPYQGSLLFANRNYVQVWSVDPDPSNFKAIQTLPNIGTFAPASMQAVGDMDVYMLYDSGFRSVRVRDASNNAIIADVGTPVDLLVQQLLAPLSDAQKASCPGIVDPAANRYWCYIPTAADSPSTGVTGKIYVFSYFTSSQVAAWSTYSPTFQTAISSPGANYPSSGTVALTYTGLTIGAQYAWNPGANEKSINVSTGPGGTAAFQGYVFTAVATTLTVTGSANSATFTGQLNLINFFVPQKFEIYNGQVWVRDTANNLFQYGGPGNAVYENCGVTGVTPFIDSGLPGNIKTFKALEASFAGTWQISACADYTANIFRSVYFNNQPTYAFKRIGYDAKGTHYAFQFGEFGTGYARLSSALMHIANPPQGAEK